MMVVNDVTMDASPDGLGGTRIRHRLRPDDRRRGIDPS